jgi:lipoate-protein ligase A
MTWRLLVDGPSTGAWNMAVDEALVEAVDNGSSPPTLRLYRWRPPCLSLGFAQPPEAADWSFCTAHGIDVVRRPTGGRAVLHHLEQTYSVTAPLGHGRFGHDLQATYQAICRALVAGLERLGVRAELAGRPGDGMIRPNQPVPCFVGPAAGEVVAQGRKLVGSAMRRVGSSILQHGSILEEWDGALQAGSLGLPDDGGLRPSVVTLRDLVGEVPKRDALAEALVAGFEESFGVACAPGQLLEAERVRAGVLFRERYGHQRWTMYRDHGTGAST